MSKRERERLVVLAGVKRRELTLVQASGVLSLSYRQTKRIWRRYQKEGDGGLVHRLRGQPSRRRKTAEVRAQVLTLQAQERYADFGPTLLADHPWRRLGMGVGKEFWRGVKAQGRAARAAKRLGLRASGRPTLRSGLPASRRPNRTNEQRTNHRTRGHSLLS